jgi:hypothetical protein
MLFTSPAPLRLLLVAHSPNSVSSTSQSLTLSLSCELTDFRASGIRGLYRGLTPELLKVVPMVGITFCTFEMCSEFLRTSSRL